MDVRTRLEHALGVAYTIDRELAGGGMSHVYVAEERAFGRLVVVKALREDLTEGASAARFKREISVAAKLQHPHIVPLLSAGEDGGTLYFTMPFVEGESLRARLSREGELPVADVVRVLRDVASALAYAHRHGIVHRDIKPENVLFSDGNALVTDFGIAKALEAARTQGDGPSSTISQLGVALGTPAYMAPEQGAADPTVDHRADLYALGCVGYEMLTGRPPFEGRAARQLLAAHATEAPKPIGQRRANAPPGLAALVMQCLEKSAADRPQSAADVLRALDGLVITPAGTTLSTLTAPAGVRARSRVWGAMLACGLIIAALGVGAIFARWRDGGAHGPAIYDVGLADDAPIVFRGQLSLSISPRGDFVVYVTETPAGVSQLRYRSLTDSVERTLTGTDAGFAPQVSPDARSVAFIRDVKNAEGLVRARLEIVDVRGGQSRVLGDLRATVGIRWVSESRFFVVDDDGLKLRWFDPQSGEIGKGIAIKSCLSPSSPDHGQSLLCGGGSRKLGTISSASSRSDRLLRRALGTATALTQPVVGSHFRVVDGRYLVFLSNDGELRAARIDLATLEVGRAVTLVSGVRRESYQNLGQFDIATNGTLTYAQGENAEVGYMMIVHPQSREHPIDTLLAEAAAFQRFDPSPDGRRIAVVVQGRDAQELWLHDLADGRSAPWLTAPAIGHALWSPRGDRIAVRLTYENSSALVIGSPDAGASLDTLIRGSSENPAPDPASWRSDTILLARVPGMGSVLSIDPRPTGRRVDTVLRSAGFADLSPDGRLIVFNRLGLTDAVITPLTAMNRSSQLSEASEAQWVSMTTVRFRGVQGSWYEITVDSASGRVRGAPRLYYSDPRFADTPGWSHRAASNGGMIYVQGPARTTAAYLRVVPNWVAKMKQAVDSADANTK